MSASMHVITDVSKRIFEVRGMRIMIDSDLAVLYGVSTKRLNEQVKRNRKRFPKAFMFQATPEEAQILRSQFGDGLGNSVDLMTVAGDGRSEANESGDPQQQGFWVGAGATAAQHLAQKAAHGFDRVGGEWQAEIGMSEIRTIER